jgi:cation transport regulator
MPNKQSSSKKGSRNTRLSARTRKQIDSLPVHAQHIFKKTDDSTVEQYQDPEKRRGGRKQKRRSSRP